MVKLIDALDLSLKIPGDQLNEMLSKAINTQEPQKQYSWVMPLCQLLDDKKRKFNIMIELT